MFARNVTAVTCPKILQDVEVSLGPLWGTDLGPGAGILPQGSRNPRLPGMGGQVGLFLGACKPRTQHEGASIPQQEEQMQ